MSVGRDNASTFRVQPASSLQRCQAGARGVEKIIFRNKDANEMAVGDAARESQSELTRLQTPPI